jgi:NADH-quinone oxidoreductase subunit M
VLNLILLLPFIAALLVLLGAPARRTALISSGITFLLSLYTLLSYDQTRAGFQFVFSKVVISEWDLKYLLAVDGLSLLMLLLASVVTLAAVWVAPRIERRENLFYACILLLSAGAIGAFLSQDLFFFYAFHEVALIPTFLLIGIWGAGDRQAVAWKITIYLALGSAVLLVGLLDLYHAIPAGQRTFDMMKLGQLAGSGLIPASAQARPFAFLLVGFGILVSLFPFHTWAPSAYASAPAPAAMLHAGVLKKFGLYGLIRLALPLLPEGAKTWAWLLLILLVGNIIYVGLVTIGQRRLDLMLGYSSVMHMGYIFLGVASLNQVGVTGAALLMFAHGLSIATLLGLAGHLRQFSPTLSFDSLGGLAKQMPFFAAAFGAAAFASIGLPGFANFAAELLVFFGAYKTSFAAPLAGNFKIATGFALWGVVISAVYMLRAYRAGFLGPQKPDSSHWTDLCTSIRLPYLLLLLLLVLSGFFPNILINLVKPSIRALLAN